jgi:hypothetical protein
MLIDNNTGQEIIQLHVTSVIINGVWNFSLFIKAANFTNQTLLDHCTGPRVLSSCIISIRE